MRIPISEVKRHLRILSNDEDQLIAGITLAAEDHVVQFLGEDFAPYLDEDNDAEEFEVIPAPIKAAIMLLIGDLYENRERMLGTRTLHENPTYMLLLNPYRSMGIV